MMPDRGEVKESVDLCKKEIYYEILDSKKF